MDIDVHVEGVANKKIAEAIRTRIRRIGRADTRRGEWRITVSPSETRGQWDLGVEAPSGRHFASFTEAVDRLPDLVEQKLRELLDLPAPTRTR
jgi:hypothetical protein